MKTIDVREIDVQDGDTWTAHQSEFRLLQHRDGKNREINSLGYSRWHDHCASWEQIPSWMAMDAIGRLGYTLTPAAKPEAKPAARVVKAPGRINASEYAQTHWPISVIPYVENAIAFTHLRWREALASQGFKVEDAE